MHVLVLACGCGTHMMISERNSLFQLTIRDATEYFTRLTARGTPPPLAAAWRTRAAAPSSVGVRGELNLLEASFCAGHDEQDVVNLVVERVSEEPMLRCVSVRRCVDVA